MKVSDFVGFQALSGDRRSCGSAFPLGVIGQFAYVGSNAHVWGTSVNAPCFVRGVTESGDVVEVRGRLRMAGYRSGASIDWAIAELALSDYLRLPGASADVRLVDFDPSRSIGYVGGPRCELPSFRRVKFARSTGAVVYGTPAAISGMSGGAWQHDGRPCAVTTWTDGKHNMAQPAQALRKTMRPEFFSAFDDPQVAFSVDGFCREDFLLPDGAVPVCDCPQECEDGYHGLENDLSGSELLDVIDAQPRTPEKVEDFDWMELLRLLLPILLEFLRNRR